MNLQSLALWLLIGMPLFAEEAWVGKAVLAKNGEAPTRTRPDGALPTEPAGGPFVVVRDQGGWLELKSGMGSQIELKVPGGDGRSSLLSTEPEELLPVESVWGVKTHFVLMTEAKFFFSERIRLNDNDESALLGRARVFLYGENDPDAALRDLDSVLKLNSKSRLARLNRATLFDHIGGSLATIRELTELIRLLPKDAEARNNRAIAMANRGRHDEAISDLTEAIRLEPEKWCYRQSLGVLHGKFGDSSSARTVLDDAIARHPRIAQLHRTRGLIRQNQGDLDGAIQDLDQALKLDPTLLLAKANRGWVWHLKKDHVKSLKDMDEVIEQGFRHALVLNNRGFVRHEVGRYAEALADFDEALKGHKSVAAVLNANRAATLLEIENQKIAANPKDVQSLVNRASAYLHNRDMEAALSDCDKVLAIDPQNAVVLNQRASIFMEIGETDRAIREIDEAIRLDPKEMLYPRNRLSFRIRAIAGSSKKEDLTQCLREADQLVKADPQSGNTRNHRAMLRLMLEDTDGALADYTEAIRLDPSLSYAFASRAVIYHGKGEADKALADQLRAVALAPSNTLNWISLAEMYRSKKQFAKALQSLQRSIHAAGINPSPEGMLCLAWFQSTCPNAEFRDGENAIALARQAGQKMAWSDSKARSTLGAAFAETGDFAKAVDWEELALLDSSLSKDLRAGREARLNLYREKKPYREVD